MLNQFMNILKKSPWDNPEEDKENIFNFKSRKRPNNPFSNFNFNNNLFNNNIIFIVLGFLFIAWLASGIYKVDEGEEAVILRFGKFVRIDRPGLNYHFPEPFERVITEKVDKSRRIEIGYRSVNQRNFGLANRRSQESDGGYRYLPEESIMLTGDENIVDLNCDVMWRIKKLTDYIFNVVNPEEAVKAAAESSIREVIGKTPISHVLSNQKQDIVEKIQKLTQKILDQYGTGIHIENVQLLKAEPPTEVIDSYRDVQTSRADKEREINQAQAYKNDILPRARGEAAKMVQEAEGYKQEVVAKAKGDADRFVAVFREYTHQRGVTRERLYLDAAEEILKGSRKIIVPKNQLLPHMAIQPNEMNIKR
ncbi:MAG: hflK [Rickettsiaceae bacterium]|jgi:membrane protease subunit HflK|nr:hflK [Rickettsiaceae bacterium]